MMAVIFQVCTIGNFILWPDETWLLQATKHSREHYCVTEMLRVVYQEMGFYYLYKIVLP